MTWSLLVFGFLLGVKHALEADHVAAVASLATRSASWRDHVALAGLWGAGHALTLVVVGSVVVALGATLPPSLAAGFDGAVGVMLIVLGVDVLRRLRAGRVHLHVHRHRGGPRHLHVHGHAPDEHHDVAHHEHVHGRGVTWRALLVGTMHGLAGSAALVLVAVAETRSIPAAVAYLVLFGAGSILGMVALSLAISVPLRLSMRHLGALRFGLQGVLGSATIALGCWMALQLFVAP
ncbi:MAG TPA: urease accessory protein [Candidatus Binatia bacterium]